MKFKARNVSKLEIALFTVIAFLSLFTIFQGSYNNSLDSNSSKAGINHGFNSYKAIVIFRNDDVAGVSKQFKQVNRVFMEEEVPVTHGLIPKRLEENSEDLTITCEQLKNIKQQNGKLIEYAAHGYNHKGKEFINDPGLIRNKTERVEKFFLDCLSEKPVTFIPPHNEFSASSRLILTNNNYEVLSANRESLLQVNKLLLYNKTGLNNDKVIEIGQSSRMVESWSGSSTQLNSAKVMRNDFDESLGENNIHVQVLHHKTIDSKEDREKIREIIKYMKSHNVAFMTFNELIKGIREGNILNNGDRWFVA